MTKIPLDQITLHSPAECFPLPSTKTLNATKVPGLSLHMVARGVHWEVKHKDGKAHAGLFPDGAIHCLKFSTQQK